MTVFIHFQTDYFVPRPKEFIRFWKILHEVIEVLIMILIFINQFNRKWIKKPLIQTSQDPRIQAEGKAGQSTDKGIIFVSENNFDSDAGSEWIIGTCIKSPCVAAGNNELVSAYR